MTIVSKCDYCNRMMMHEDYDEKVIFDSGRHKETIYVCKTCMDISDGQRFDFVYNERISKFENSVKINIDAIINNILKEE